MMQKDLDLNTYLFGTTKEELPEADVKEMTERLHKEMNEIFYGRNMPDMTQYNT
jgi:S-adenosylmethionine decarboxylase